MDSNPQRFFADAMLGRLARRIRLAGFDTAYERQIDDGALILRAQQEERIIVTRDRRLLLRRGAQDGVLIRTDRIADQWEELAARFPHLRHGAALSRCAECNALIEDLPVEQARSLVPIYVFQTQTRFYRCPGCFHVYWPGTHVPKILGMVKAARSY